MADQLDLLNEALQGRYTIEREIGRGTMATVYLARDVRLHRPVALKILHPDFTPVSGVRRFLQEIALTARLNHPNILALHDSGEAGGYLYYVTSYVSGESLRQRLEREPQLTLEEAIRITTAVAAGLTHAHRAGIVHRDVKPENILLATDSADGPSHPLLADFSIARALDAAAGERLTEGMAVGTPAYMSPEQASGKGPIDGRSDVYSLGCVSYEMLAGSPPFGGPTPQAILARHTADPVPPLSTVRAGVPAQVAIAIERALAKVPADRFATVAEFARALVVEGEPHSFRRPRPFVGRAGLWAAMTAALVGAAFALEAWRSFTTSALIPSGSRIAVLPFSATRGDTALTRLGRDLSVTLSASLDGVGGLEIADRLVIASETSHRNALPPAEAAALALRLGASRMVLGSLGRAGDSVRLDLTLYRSDDLSPLGEISTVRGHRDSIASLTDSAAWALLRQVWRRGDPPSSSLTAATTTSLPALRAFLDGERELGAGRWDEAALAFRGAIAADSGFTVAYARYALSRMWMEQPIEPELMAGLRHHRHRLPEQERLLFEVTFLEELPVRERLERLRAVTVRFPHYWPAWFLYGDLLAHWGPLAGHEWTEGRDAFQRVIAINSRLVPAWEHLFVMAVARDPEEASRALAQLMELGWAEANDLRSRLWIGVSRGGGVIPPELDLAADSLAELMISSPMGYAHKYGAHGLMLLHHGFPAAQLDLNRRVLQSPAAATRPRLIMMMDASNGWCWATSGQWDSALVAMQQLSLRHRGPVGPPGFSVVVGVESYALAVLGAWLGATRPSLADERRPTALAAVEHLTEEEEKGAALARVAWLDGLLGLVRRDVGAIRQAREATRRSGYEYTSAVDRSLSAFLKAAAGDRVGAARDLVALEEDCLIAGKCDAFLFTPHIAVHRLSAAEWLSEAGETKEALRLLRYTDEWQTGGWRWTIHLVLAGPSYLARARLEEALGESAAARASYQQFLRRYYQPGPSQLHLVEEAKTALARLQVNR